MFLSISLQIFSISIFKMIFPAARCPSPVTRRPLPVARPMSPVTRWPSLVARRASPVARRMSRVARRPSAVARRPLPVARRMSPAARCPSAVARSLPAVSGCPLPRGKHTPGFLHSQTGSLSKLLPSIAGLVDVTHHSHPVLRLIHGQYRSHISQ